MTLPTALAGLRLVWSITEQEMESDGLHNLYRDSAAARERGDEWTPKPVLKFATLRPAPLTLFFSHLKTPTESGISLRSPPHVFISSCVCSSLQRLSSYQSGVSRRRSCAPRECQVCTSHISPTQSLGWVWDGRLVNRVRLSHCGNCGKGDRHGIPRPHPCFG
ncbi:hypothetical protein B0T25DRAFT_181774 [Lasiosphaeria hispida]|uniref:Uncharacterized protein n=1 Tax=Lasiosphaeria hispida TaxID=260671 RepID=A0AAJ0HGQ2_9PEZI|nr:hypothetical protein B0T25DRAFT_181774 [Lasiosphaeria hispida]